MFFEDWSFVTIKVVRRFFFLEVTGEFSCEKGDEMESVVEVFSEIKLVFGNRMF